MPILLTGCGPTSVAGIVSGMSFDFNATQIVAANNDPVSTMVDSSGVTGNLTVSGSATYKTAGINGHPSILFGGSAFFERDNVDPTSLVGGGAWTMHLVFDGGAGIMSYAPGGTTGGVLVSGGTVYFDFPNGGGRVSVALDFTSAGVLTFICNGTARKARINGTEVLNTTATNYAPSGTGKLVIGGYYGVAGMSGNLGRCLIYPSVLTSGQITQNEAYLKSQFGTP